VSGGRRCYSTPLRRDWWIYALLFLAIAAAYAQVYDFQFVNYDDPDYVTENLHVRGGLTASGVDWAFQSTEYANWLPLTWLSHMLDVELYGLQSGRHHLTSVAIHALTTLLLFGLLKRITGDRWPSAFVAFIFGLHPLHVESVSWIAERKDVLSALFYILALWAYVRYVERPGAMRYAVIVIMFACGIMAKPMIVTLPFVALLLDVWPLRRFSRKTVVEKIPLFALSAASALTAYLVQQRGGAVNTLAEIPFTLRLENAAIAYVTYIFQFFWPMRLAVFYPFPQAVPAWEWIAAVIALIAITIVALRSPPLTVGWFWYLGTLVPVIGLVKIGLQSHADRYSYVPLIGLSIAIAWGVQSFAKQHRWVAIPIALWACATCAGTFFQVATWRNSTTLFEHALAVTDGNYVAQNNLGVALRHAGRRPEAVAHFEEALRLWPQYPEAQTNVGEALLTAGRLDEAIPHIAEALRLDPRLPEAHINLGSVRNKQGRPDLAEAEYRTALELKPSSAEAHDGLAVVLAETDRSEEALKHALEAIALDPDDADSHYNLGRLYGLTGRTDQAIDQFRETVRLEPANAEAHFNLGTAYAQKDQMNQAIAEFSAAVRTKPDYAAAHFNLASALARLDRYDEAIAEFTEALRLNPNLPGAREAIEYCRSLRARR
jgi:tetratricopeptide (TPR) repeat protein